MSVKTARSRLASTPSATSTARSAKAASAAAPRVRELMRLPASGAKVFRHATQGGQYQDPDDWKPELIAAHGSLRLPRSGNT